VVPSELHDPILQDAVLLKAGQDREAALALMRFLRSQEVRRLIREAGYEP
jgi:molybdate transport system substrate-binding protein